MVSDFRPRESFQFFLQESVELLQNLEQGLLEVRENNSTQSVHNLMRIVHSIKGGAACVGLNHVKKIAHNLENVLKTLYEINIEIDLELEELLLQAYDRLKSPLMDEIHYGGSDPQEAIDNAKGLWKQLETKLGIDFADPHQKITVPFAGEILQGLERLKNILQDAHRQEIGGVLKLQLKLFRNLAELGKMNDFLNIANHALTSLENNPASSHEIGIKALRDFQFAYQVLTKKVQDQHRVKSANQNNSSQQPLNKNYLILTSEPEVNKLESSAQAAKNTSFPKFASPSPSLPRLESAIVESTITSSSIVKSSEEAAKTEQNAFLEPIERSPKPVIANNQNHLNQSSSTENSSQLANFANSPNSSSLAKIEHSENENDTSNNHKLTSSTLGTRIDNSRLELLHKLVGKLGAQDYQLILQTQQNKETLISLTQWYERFKDLNQNLKSWLECLPNNAWQSGLSDYQTNTHHQVNQHLQSSLENLLEELSQLGEGLQDLTFLDLGFEKILKTRQKTLKKLRNNLLEASMLPIGELLTQFPRMVRDSAISKGKEIKLKFYGEQTLVDKAILEKLYDPLVHLLRNAIAHGIESPLIRQHKNKPTWGTITISTYHQGNHTFIEIKDDGKGINWDKIRLKLIQKNNISPVDAQKLTPEQLTKWLFASGFSTSSSISTLSGRGMGLDSVKKQINSLKGIIKVDSQLDIGTNFIIRLPLALSIIKLLVFSVGSNLLAIPADSLQSIVLVDQRDIQTEQQQQYYEWQGQAIPICPESLLSSCFHPRIENSSTSMTNRDWQNIYRIPLLLISNDSEMIAIKIDQIVLEQDLAIKPFAKEVATPSSLLGCTVLEDGRSIPVINSVALIDKWLQINEPQSPDSYLNQANSNPYDSAGQDFDKHDEIAFPNQATILIVDDSITIRHTLSIILTKAGYLVIEAEDGLEAIEKLRKTNDIQAVISDIEMPRMNGLELISQTRQLKGDFLPIIMLTSRSGQKYRQLAHNLGASHYLTKPIVEKKILSSLKQYLHN